MEMVRSYMSGSDAGLTCSRAVEDDVLVGLVRDQPELALPDNRGDAFEVGAGQDAAGRIVRRVDVDRAGRRRDARLELVEVEAPVETLVQRATHRTGLRGEHVAGARRPRRVRQDHFVAGLEQRLADEIERMNPAGRHHHLVGVADRNAVGAAQLLGEQLEQPGNAGRLEVVALVLVDGAAHRRLDRVGRVEADVALIEPEGVLDRVHHVADADDAGERDDVEVFAHCSSDPVRRLTGFSIAARALELIVLLRKQHVEAGQRSVTAA